MLREDGVFRGSDNYTGVTVIRGDDSCEGDRLCEAVVIPVYVWKHPPDTSTPAQAGIQLIMTGPPLPRG